MNQINIVLFKHKLGFCMEKIKEKLDTILIEKHSSSSEFQPKLRQTIKIQTYTKASEHLNQNVKRLIRISNKTKMIQ